jgi:hypothetical protein
MLNLVTHQLLRQQQAAALADLRRLSSDWHALSSSAELDPLLAMELEAAEAAAERAILAEVFKLIAARQFAEADAKLDSLGAPRYLPVAALQVLPTLRADLNRTAVFSRAQEELKVQPTRFAKVWAPFANVPRNQIPLELRASADAWRVLSVVNYLLGYRFGGDPVESTSPEVALKQVADSVSPALAAKLRVELAAWLYFNNKPDDAVKLLEGEVDGFHAADVLADLRTFVLGSGEPLKTVDHSRWAAATGAGDKIPPRHAAAILPPERLANWRLPQGKPATSTVDFAIDREKKQFKTIVDAEASTSTAKVNMAADRIRETLAADAAQTKVFLDKVVAVRDKPFASPGEEQLAVTAATYGLTVAEVIGVLSAEADRPAVAARVFASVPVFMNPGAFASWVELSRRAPASFTTHADAGFKLTAIRARARVRDAVAFILNAHAAKVAASNPAEPLSRAALEAAVEKRLSLDANTISPAEYAQALVDTCRDWAEDFGQLNNAERELNSLIASFEAGSFDPNDGDAKEVLAHAKTAHKAIQQDAKRRHTGVASGCQLLGKYGRAAGPARDWLREQGDGKPWHTEAAAALEKIGVK